MVTAIEFITADEYLGWQKNGPDAEPGDRLKITGTPNAGGFNIFDVEGHCGALPNWPHGSVDGLIFVNAPPPEAPRGLNRGILFLRIGDTAVRGDTLINVTEQVGTTCIELLNGIERTFQLYKADLE